MGQLQAISLIKAREEDRECDYYEIVCQEETR